MNWINAVQDITALVLYWIVIVGVATVFVLYVAMIMALEWMYRLAHWCKRSFYRWIFGGYKLD